MLYRIFSRIKFLFSATNQHGVHSPFVYDFVTKGLYKKTSKSALIEKKLELNNLSNKEQNILSKIIKYFEIEELNTIKSTSTNTLDKPRKLLYLSNLNHFNPTESKVYSCIIIHDIYSSKNDQANWNNLIKLPEATVTIDLYYFGLIFFKSGQRKEHFKIRV